ncbi:MULTISPECIES: hypothetical protein [Streptomyces]|uniref:hypothetical protein n=1 Tax=Streptomyces TaxID=1883 RepID=UPI0029A4110E|nr:hypothetical protein [Streptomyces sp. WI03-4A]MDX2591355.1 hypothetical protein [Streptomyces sp. WI03-4A]
MTDAGGQRQLELAELVLERAERIRKRGDRQLRNRSPYDGDDVLALILEDIQCEREWLWSQWSAGAVRNINATIMAAASGAIRRLLTQTHKEAPSSDPHDPSVLPVPGAVEELPLPEEVQWADLRRDMAALGLTADERFLVETLLRNGERHDFARLYHAYADYRREAYADLPVAEQTRFENRCRQRLRRALSTLRTGWPGQCGKGEADG